MVAEFCFFFLRSDYDFLKTFIPLFCVCMCVYTYIYIVISEL